jgi:nucleotidyltransferase/DNA polymerase involved in DNA repair
VTDEDRAVTPRLRKIIHIDMDAFYICRTRDNPELRGKPVAMGVGPGHVN